MVLRWPLRRIGLLFWVFLGGLFIFVCFCVCVCVVFFYLSSCSDKHNGLLLYNTVVNLHPFEWWQLCVSLWTILFSLLANAFSHMSLERMGQAGLVLQELFDQGRALKDLIKRLNFSWDWWFDVCSFLFIFWYLENKDWILLTI